MKKPIIATRFVNVFIDSTPWRRAHILWFEDAAQKLQRPDIKDWGIIYTQEEDYMQKVDEIMNLQYPNLKDEEKNEKARELFFNYVLKYIDQNPSSINKKAIEKFTKLKQKYTLALVSTNTKEVIQKLLKNADLENFFDIIHTSQKKEKDNTPKLLQDFEKKYEKPIIYIQSFEELERFK